MRILKTITALLLVLLPAVEGVIVTGDSLRPISFVSIVIKNSYRGTISDFNGFFSFVAQMNDTIEFSALGYKKSTYVIPDTLKTDRYSLIKILSKDTILLQETVIYPWPTKDQFKYAFLTPPGSPKTDTFTPPSALPDLSVIFPFMVALPCEKTLPE